MESGTKLGTKGRFYPAEWEVAFAREHSDFPLPADPRPERQAGRVLGAFVLSGLAFLALPGTLLGVLNLLSIAGRQSPTGAHTAWIQAHGQAQLLGWVGTFILGISIYVLPKIQGRGLKSFKEPWAIWTLWTAGVGLRWWAGIGAGPWRAFLVVAAILELAAYILTLRLLIFPPGRRRRRMPQDLSSWLGMSGFTALGIALLLSLSISLQMVRATVFPVVPPSLDRTLILIEVWGFVVPVAWGYSARFVTILLGLDHPDYRFAKWLSAGILLLIVLALARKYLLSDLLALILTLASVHALHVLRPGRRPPKLFGAHRHYPYFVRVAFVWLVVGTTLGPLADYFPSLTGLGGASRHAVTVGFIATFIFAIGQRMLPSFMNGRELYSLGLMGASLWTLNLGCLLRVSAESVAYSSGGLAWSLLPLSAFLELAAVLMFVANLGLSLAHPMLVWFGPEGIKPTMTLYWCVSSFPGTRNLLIKTGLRTLNRAHEVPRTLTLAEAARADDVNLDRILEELRIFFSRRHPGRPSDASGMA